MKKCKCFDNTFHIAPNNLTSPTESYSIIYLAFFIFHKLILGSSLEFSSVSSKILVLTIYHCFRGDIIFFSDIISTMVQGTFHYNTGQWTIHYFAKVAHITKFNRSSNIPSC